MCLNTWREMGFTLEYLCVFFFIIAKEWFHGSGIAVNANPPVLKGHTLLRSWCNASGAWETRCPGRNAAILMALHCPTSLALSSAIALPGWHLLALLSPLPSPAHLLHVPQFWASGQEWLSKDAFAQRIYEGQTSAVLRKIELSSTWVQSAAAWGCYLQPLSEGTLCRAKLNLSPPTC